MHKHSPCFCAINRCSCYLVNFTMATRQTQDQYVLKDATGYNQQRKEHTKSCTHRLMIPDRHTLSAWVALSCTPHHHSQQQWQHWSLQSSQAIYLFIWHIIKRLTSSVNSSSELQVLIIFIIYKSTSTINCNQLIKEIINT